jgi:hypothetical protein
MQSVFVDSDIDAAPRQSAADRMIDFQEFFQARIAVAQVALPSTAAPQTGRTIDSRTSASMIVGM